MGDYIGLIGRRCSMRMKKLEARIILFQSSVLIDHHERKISSALYNCLFKLACTCVQSLIKLDNQYSCNALLYSD